MNPSHVLYIRTYVGVTMASVAETTHPLSADELTMAKLLILADVQRGRLKEALERATLVAKEEDPLLQELRR